MKKIGRIAAFLIVFLVIVVRVPQVRATQRSVLGIHILNPAEIGAAKQLLSPTDNDDWHYLTIPLTLDDLNKQNDWQHFFDYAKKQKLIPIVRLTSHFENGVWQVPTKKNIVDLITFLSSLNWPTADRYIIVFNEVNHAKEWGGVIDPAAYTATLKFTSNWAKSENKNYSVLPAAMDLAASTGGESQEGFAYLDQMQKSEPHIFSYVDYWNSHSYPNPAFSAPPTATGKNSLSGFLTELSYLKAKTGREFETFITETGWSENYVTRPRLLAYYDFAVNHVWSDPRIKAVTPFVLRGDPGPFSSFTFLTQSGQQTAQYRAYQSEIKKLAAQK